MKLLPKPLKKFADVPLPASVQYRTVPPGSLACVVAADIYIDGELIVTIGTLHARVAADYPALHAEWKTLIGKIARVMVVDAVCSRES